MPVQHIIDHCGLTITRYEPVHGGDISHAWCLHGKDAKYFLKVNDAKKFPGMFEKEKDGLRALQQNSILSVPRMLACGESEQEQYLLLEWLDKGSMRKDCWQHFGAAIAAMHRQRQPFFGWQEDNYIGSLTQHNLQYSQWHSFYTECRIMPLVRDLFDSGSFSKQELGLAESFCKKIEQLFPGEHASLLHGDLWSGNYMITSHGHAAIFDPAVYNGHREMDIGMTCLFGGFGQQFYDSYNEVYPLEKGWQQRLRLTQLYPILVHAVLFGGHYLATAREIMKQVSG